MKKTTEEEQFNIKILDTLKLNGIEVETEHKMNNPNKERRNKRFFASDLPKVNKESKSTFLEKFSMNDAMKLNKQDDVINNIVSVA